MNRCRETVQEGGGFVRLLKKKGDSKRARKCIIVLLNGVKQGVVLCARALGRSGEEFVKVSKPTSV